MLISDQKSKLDVGKETENRNLNSAADRWIPGCSYILNTATGLVLLSEKRQDGTTVVGGGEKHKIFLCM